MGKIEDIKLAIENAEKGISKLTDEVINNVGGYTSPAIRHLLNNLGSNVTDYLEIGSHRGATFVSTCYKNENIKMRMAIDNLSEFNEDNSVLVDFSRNANKYVEEYTFINKDCFSIKHDEFKNKPNLYLYDGNHSIESHEKALTYFYDMLPGEFIYLLDDSNWQEVKLGTMSGITKTNLTVMYEHHLTDERWHMGFSIFILKKTV